MAATMPRIVIIGAGMAGLAAANKLFKSKHLFELTIVEGGSRIGGRINTSQFGGDQIELGATWIHGIEGNPIYKIANEARLFHSSRPSELKDGFPDDILSVAEGGHVLNPSIVNPISRLFNNLTNSIRGKAIEEENGVTSEVIQHLSRNYNPRNLSVGSFLRQGLDAYWGFVKDRKEVEMIGNWSRKDLEEAIFRTHENFEKSISAVDMGVLDYNAEKEYNSFPGDDITIARGYSSVVEALASVLPVGMIQLGKKVEKIEWQLDNDKPVKLHFGDGTSLSADHVIVTVSLGVLKQHCGLFDPPLPDLKTSAISRLGFGLLNKVFLHLSCDDQEFPTLQMVFHEPDSVLRCPEIPNWIRSTSILYPIYRNSRTVLSWFAGEEAVEIESLSEEEIAEGFSSTVLSLLSKNDNGEKQLKFCRVLRTQWGSDPLFLGSYSFVAVGSSVEDMDILAEPLPQNSGLGSSPQLQILFAGEATHRTHYSTTHGAYLSGIREANRLLQRYNFTDA